MEDNCEFYPIQPTSVRHDPNFPSWFEYWQLFCKSSTSSDDGLQGRLFQYKHSNDIERVTSFDCSSMYKNLSETPRLQFLIDEIDSKLYFCQLPLPLLKETFCNITFEEIPVKIEDVSDGNKRQIEKTGKSTLFLARIPNYIERNRSTEDVSNCISDTGTCPSICRLFLNPFDGSIFFLFSYSKKTATVCYIHWLKFNPDTCSPFDDTFQHCMVTSYERVEIPGLLHPTSDPSALQLSNDKKKLLVRFRSPIFTKESSFLDTDLRANFEKFVDALDMNDTIYESMGHNVPSYVVFGLNYETRRIQLLNQFSPNWCLNELHSDLLISKKLQPIVCDRFGQQPTGARSLVSQRSLMIGKFKKYTFFAIPLKEKLGILAVKSLPETIISMEHCLTPKKIWFPMDDLAFRQAFNQLPGNKKTKLIRLLSSLEKNITVAGNELMVQLKEEAVKFMGTVRVKLDQRYKDYRTCAGCGKQETKKRRSTNGKRLADFKVCGWCKNNGLHKLWWVRSCHYCSEECADAHWPKHKLEHEQKIDISFVDPPKKKKKKL